MLCTESMFFVYRVMTSIFSKTLQCTRGEKDKLDTKMSCPSSFRSESFAELYWAIEEVFTIFDKSFWSPIISMGAEQKYYEHLTKADKGKGMIHISKQGAFTGGQARRKSSVDCKREERMPKSGMLALETFGP